MAPHAQQACAPQASTACPGSAIGHREGITVARVWHPACLRTCHSAMRSLSFRS